MAFSFTFIHALQVAQMNDEVTVIGDSLDLKWKSFALLLGVVCIGVRIEGDAPPAILEASRTART